MKTNKTVSLASITLVLMFFFPFSAAAQKKGNTQTAVIKTKIYCDHCKQCETCGDKFSKDLYNETGIKRVDVDSKVMTITVVYDDRKITIEKIRELISNLGYDADDVKADPAGIAKLDGCCKK